VQQLLHCTIVIARGLVKAGRADFAAAHKNCRAHAAAGALKMVVSPIARPRAMMTATMRRSRSDSGMAWMIR
jgi:hypothetical protein